MVQYLLSYPVLLASAYHHFLDTARFFQPIDAPYDSYDEDQPIPERPDDQMHYLNYPAKPAVQVLAELGAKYRDLDWIPKRLPKGWPEILTAQDDVYEKTPNAVCRPSSLQLYRSLN